MITSSHSFRVSFITVWESPDSNRPGANLRPAMRILTACSAASNLARASSRLSADPITAAPAAAPVAW